MLFRLFPARATRPAPTRRPARLGLEELGGRYAPSDVLPSNPTSDVSAVQTFAAQPMPGMDLNVDLSNGQYCISGTITGYTPGMTVTIQGGPLHGQSVSISDDGTFSVVFTTTDPTAVTFTLRAADGTQVDQQTVEVG